MLEDGMGQWDLEVEWGLRVCLLHYFFLLWCSVADAIACASLDGLSEVDVLGLHAELLELPPHDWKGRLLGCTVLEGEDHVAIQILVEER